MIRVSHLVMFRMAWLGWTEPFVSRQACIDGATRLLADLERELRERANTRPRGMKFESGRLRPEDEQAIRPVGYVAELG